MHEVDIDTVDLGQMMTILVELIFAAPPVIAGPPMFDDGFDIIERNALRPVVNRLGIRPAHMAQPDIQIVQRGLRDINIIVSDFVTHNMSSYIRST